MKITYREFFTALIGARMFDQHSPQFGMEKSLFQQFCFEDSGVYYIPAEQRHRWHSADDELMAIKREVQAALGLDWGADVKRRPGYFEPKTMVVQ